MTTAKLIDGEYVINGEKVSVLAQGCKFHLVEVSARYPATLEETLNIGL
jgi:hypothetical protein